MTDELFGNAYSAGDYAAAYAALGFRGTYGLAYRDLPALYREYVTGPAALDFGCGAGRSTRFLGALGFEPVGIDISEAMLVLARRADPEGEYLLMDDGDFAPLGERRFDLVQALFTFDNVQGDAHRVALLRELRARLRPDGTLTLVASAPELYTHDWVSFETTRFPENAEAESGDLVRIVVTDIDDRRPVRDVFRWDEDYRREFEMAGLELVRTHRPLATGEEEGEEWVSETRVSPWLIYVLRRAGG